MKIIDKKLIFLFYLLRKKKKKKNIQNKFFSQKANYFKKFYGKTN